jgi:hypothetical protein
MRRDAGRAADSRNPRSEDPAAAIRHPRGAPLLAALFLALSVSGLEAQDRHPLDHDVYEIWRTIGTQAISPDGGWVL